MHSLRSSFRWHAVALAISFAVAIWRQLHSVLTPSFYAEEGAVYFKTAYLESFGTALFAPQQGYYALVPNCATLAAAICVPLEYAPWVTMVCGLCVSQIPVFYILSSPAAFFDRPAARLGSVATVILLSSFVPSTLFSYVYLTLLAFLIVLEDLEESERRPRPWQNRLLLVLAGLGSPMAAFLLPVVAALAWRRPTLRPATLILFACACVQVVATLNSDTTLARRGFADFELVPPVVLFNLADVVIPFDSSQGLRRWLFESSQASGTGTIVLSIAAAALLTAAAVTVFWLMKPRALATLFVGGLLSLGLISTALGGDLLVWGLLDATSPRYTFAPTAILMIGLCHGVSQRGAARWICAVLVVLGLVAAAERHLIHPRDQSAIASWPDEVRKWRANPDYMPRTAPPGWVLPFRREVPEIVLVPRPVPGDTPKDAGRHENSAQLRILPNPWGNGPMIGEVRSAPFSIGMAYISFPMKEAAYLDLPGGRRARLHVDLSRGAIIRVHVLTDHDGVFRAQIVPWPFTPYVGEELCVQVLIQEPEMALSNALIIEVRRK